MKGLLILILLCGGCRALCQDTSRLAFTCNYFEPVATYPGGDEALMAFLSKNIRYPPCKDDHCPEGRVVISFCIMPDGCVDSAKVHKGGSPALDAEALRVVGLLPSFHPATMFGEPILMRMALPVVFKAD